MMGSGSSTTAKQNNVIEEYDQTIRFWDFSKFENLTQFPRFPNEDDGIIAPNDIDTNNSFIIFISHSWCHDNNDVDTKDNDILKLCQKGIALLRKHCAKAFNKCYIWMDYCCLNQDKSPAKSITHLNEIIMLCDCLFTPLFDPQFCTWNLHFKSPKGIINDYLASSWKGNRSSYLTRSWCCLEMLYGATIPLGKASMQKKSSFNNTFSLMLETKRRPHFIYGSKEYDADITPYSLPFLTGSDYDLYHPANGQVTVAADKLVITELSNYLFTAYNHTINATKSNESIRGQNENSMNNINSCNNSNIVSLAGIKHTQPLVNNSCPSEMATCIFQGQYVNGLYDGHGVLVQSDGSIYKGQFVEGRKDGQGVCLYPNGDHYDGEWCADVPHGLKCVMTYNRGDVYMYRGSYAEGRRHGYGKLFYADGAVFDGDFVEDVKSGEGVMRFKNGDIFTGHFDDNVFNGKGRFESAIDGKVYEGEFRNGLRHGFGRLNDVNGNSLEGMFANDNAPLDRLKCVYANGEIYE